VFLRIKKNKNEFSYSNDDKAINKNGLSISEKTVFKKVF